MQHGKPDAQEQERAQDMASHPDVTPDLCYPRCCAARELAIQAEEQFKALGAGMSLKEHVIIGGVDMQAQSRALAMRPHVVIATPGRLAVRERFGLC